MPPPPYCMGAPLPSGAGALFHADFSALSAGKLSASAFLAATGLTYARYNFASLQTSATTVDSSLTADEAGIGCSNGANKGLVVQPTMCNMNGVVPEWHSRDETYGGWNPGYPSSGPPSELTKVTLNYMAGPDGQVKANKIDIGFNETYGIYGYGPYFGPGGWNGAVTPPITLGFWAYNSTFVSDFNDGGTSGAPSFAQVVNQGASWGRHAITNNTGVGMYISPIDARDTTAIGGSAANKYFSVIMDMVTVDIGQNPGEWYPGDATYTDFDNGRMRWPDRVALAGAAQYVDSGCFTIEVTFYPKHSSSERTYFAYNTGTGTSFGVVSKWYLASADANNYVRIDPVSGHVEIAVAGTTASGTVAVSWAKDDLVRIQVRGGGGRSSKAFIQINGGSWTDLGLSGSIGGTFTIGGALAFFRDAAASTTAVTGVGNVAYDGGNLFARVKSVALQRRGFALAA